MGNLIMGSEVGTNLVTPVAADWAFEEGRKGEKSTFVSLLP